jgi:protein phosphatase
MRYFHNDRIAPVFDHNTEVSRMKVYAITDIGRVRALNEDSFYLPAQDERFCAVADGMGGHNAGEVASAMAVEVFAGEMRKCDQIDTDCMRSAVEGANAAVFAHSLQDQQCSGMGTTFTALGWQGDIAGIAHVGDSRAYLIRGNEIMRLTLDHTLVEEMVIQGLITPREAKYHPKRNYITRALGTADFVEVDVSRIQMQPGDIFFLCSDGLSNYVDDNSILEITLRTSSVEEALDQLIQGALSAGGSDNITALYAIYEEDNAK